MKDVPPLSIRAAQLFDAPFAAPLIQATIGPLGWQLTGTDNDQDAAHVIGEFFKLRGNRLSVTHTQVAEVNGRPVGLAVRYPGEFAEQLDQPFRDHRRMLGLSPEVVSEGKAGELYLDTLALLPEWRGRGYGQFMLEACAREAQSRGLTLALLVEEGNPAFNLYTRCGFRPVERQSLAGHGYLRMHLREKGG